MTPRERVLASIEHQDPGRVPIDFSGHRSSGIMAIAYAKLKQALGITSGDIYVYDLVQQLAIVEPPVLDLLGIDVIEMGRGFMTDPAEWQDWVLPDGTPCKIPGYVNVVQRGADWFIVDEGGIAFSGEEGRLALCPGDVESMKPYLGREVYLGIRPEDIHAPDYLPDLPHSCSIETQVDVIEPMGNEIFLYVKSGKAELAARVDPRQEARVGGSLPLFLDMDKAHFFDAKTEEVLA